MIKYTSYLTKEELLQMDKNTQRTFAGIEEMNKRLNFKYWLKGYLNRKFGWFAKFREKQIEYYKNKYPLL